MSNLDLNRQIAVMMKFFEQKGLLSPKEFEAVRAWGEYYLNAPCWDTNVHSTDDYKDQLAALRKEIVDVRTLDDLYRWIDSCLELGIDPY